MTQLELPTGESLRDKGTAKVLKQNEAYLNRFFFEAWWQLGMRGEITSEDVVNSLFLKPTHPNAVGAAMRAFAKQHNLVVREYRKSTRPSRHAGLVGVWARP